jgi:hypothetical protein
MAKKTKAAKAGNHVTEGGIAIEGEVITGEDTKLSVKEQGQLARGEIDEKGVKTEVEPVGKGGVKTIKTDLPLYQGTLTAKAVSAETGEEVSFRWEQAMPTTEEGCFYSFQAAHPRAIRETFVLDVTNTTDPTLRTALERP